MEIKTGLASIRKRYSMARNADSIEFDCTVIAETPKAIYIIYDDDEMWLPKSQIDNIDSIDLKFVMINGETVTLEIPEWLANRLGIE